MKMQKRLQLLERKELDDVSLKQRLTAIMIIALVIIAVIAGALMRSKMIYGNYICAIEVCYTDWPR